MKSMSSSWSGEPFEFPDTSAGALQELICIHGGPATVKEVADENEHYAQEWAALGYPI